MTRWRRRRGSAFRSSERDEGLATADLPVTSQPGPDELVRFGRQHYVAMYVWLILPSLVLLVLAVVWPINLWGWSGLGLYAAVYCRFVPPRAFWAGGVPRRLEGTDLTLRNVLGHRRIIDLATVAAAGAAGSTSRASHHGARSIVLVHPDGCTVTQRAAQRLIVAPSEIPALVKPDVRIVVVILSGAYPGRVILPIGGVLESLGIRTSPSLQRQVREARDTPASLPWWRR